MAHGHISDVVVMHTHSPVRLLLQRKLAEAGYTVTQARSYGAVRRRLRTSADPVVVVAGNRRADYRAERAFFCGLARDAALAQRHRFVLMCAIPEWLPGALHATLRGLGVRVLCTPSLLQLVETVALAAERPELHERQER